MELYTLDSNLLRTQVIDVFESLIWTERVDSPGEFELSIISTPANKALLAPGTLLALNESYRVMKVQDVEDIEDQDGRAILKIKGPSLEDMLSERSNTFPEYSESGSFKMAYEGLPGAVIRYIFEKFAVNNTVIPQDNIPFIAVGNPFPPDTIAEPDVAEVIEVDLDTLLNTIQNLCQIYKLGFRLVRGLDNSQLYFNVYSGNDRTSGQSVFPAVVFSPSLDNLSSVTEVASIGNYRNVAYVYSPLGVAVVYGDLASETVSGNERRVMNIQVSDLQYDERPYTVSVEQEAAVKRAQALTTTLQEQVDALVKLTRKERLKGADQDLIQAVITQGGLSSADQGLILAARDTSVAYNSVEDALVQAVLIQRGKEALAQQKNFSGIDGEVPQYSEYKYGVDYNLGDIVEMRNSQGVTSNMRVTEQIFVSDDQGDRSYPTLANDLFITPGTWLAWEATQYWANAPGEWINASS